MVFKKINIFSFLMLIKKRSAENIQNIKPLESLRVVLTWLFALPPHESDSKQMKIAYKIITLILILMGLMVIASSTTFIYRNVSNDLRATIFALFQSITALQMLYQSIAAILLRRKLIAIINNLYNFYDKSENSCNFSSMKNIFQFRINKPQKC